MAQDKTKKPKLALTHEEALIALEQIKEYVAFARKADMNGWGWERDCPVCGNNAPHREDEEIQEYINMMLLMGDTPKHVGARWGISNGSIIVHRKHLINGFWAFGMGSRIEANGHWVGFPADGTAEQRAMWYEQRFQWLAYQAERNKDFKEVRNCMKEAKGCGEWIDKIRTRESADSDDAKPVNVLGLTDEHEAKLIEAEKKHKAAIIDSRPAVEVNGEGRIEVEVK